MKVINKARFAEYRKRSGFSQKDFGLKLGLSDSIISNWENEDRPEYSIPLKHIDSICRILQISENEITDIESRETPAPYVSDKMNVKKESSSQETEESILNNQDLTSDQKKKMILMLKEMELENKLNKSE